MVTPQLQPPETRRWWILRIVEYRTFFAAVITTVMIIQIIMPQNMASSETCDDNEIVVFQFTELQCSPSPALPEAPFDAIEDTEPYVEQQPEIAPSSLALIIQNDYSWEDYISPFDEPQLQMCEVIIAAPVCADAVQAQLNRIKRLTAQGIVLPEFDEWGQHEPRYYDISLSQELQYFTMELCIAYGIGEYYELVLAKIFRESSFRPGVISATNDYGLAQINEQNHGWLSSTLGITDFLDPEQSILAGVHMLSGHLFAFWELGETDRVHRALMSYNMGTGGARRRWEDGDRSSGYSRRVVQTWENLLETGRT